MLIRSISGVRGLTDSGLTPEIAARYAQAFHSLVPNGALILGQDSRPSGEELLDVIVNTLTGLGRDLILCGIVPTPTVQFMVERTEASGGIVITASHNPSEWNGLKFIRKDGTFFHPDECERLFAVVDENPAQSPVSQTGMVWTDRNAIQKHVIHNLELRCIDLNAIRERRFKVVVDAVNGGAAVALPTQLESLGCEVTELNCEPTGEFSRGTEPLPEHLSELREQVRRNKADVGFAVDPDGDRLAIIDENGDPVGEEYTLVMAADGYLRSTGRREPLVTNLSTTLALDKLGETYGCPVERTPVGEIHVVRKMQELKALLGGEGNGGVILKEAHLGRDSLVAATMILNRMAMTRETVSQIRAALPQFVIIKDRINLKGVDVARTIAGLDLVFPNAEKNTLDGVKYTWSDCWIHFRQSNTEPIMRIYAEAPGAAAALELIDRAREKVVNTS